MCAGLLVLLWLRSGAFVFLAWAATFAFVVADDALQYHERVGKKLAERCDLGAVAGLRPQDSGELLAWSLAGLALLVLGWVSFRRDAPTDRRDGVVFVPVLVSLIFFGMGLDMLH
jgi:hypothetical protein